MKKMRKIFAVLLTLAMVLAMSIPTFATETGVPKAGDTAIATVTNIEAGATVTAYQIVKGDYNTNGFVKYVKADDTLAINNVTAPTSSEVTTIAAEIGTTNPKGLEAVGMTAGENGTTYTASLNAGYWVVLVRGTTRVYNPMLVGVYYSESGSDNTMKQEPVLDATSNWTLITNNAYAKSTDIAITKNAKDTANIGEEVEFTVTVDVPDYSEEYTEDVKYEVTDVLNGFEFAEDLATASKVTVSVDSNHTITTDNYTIERTDATHMKVSFKSNWVKANGKAKVTLVYKATMTGDAVNNVAHTNTATITYTNNPETTKTKSATQKVYTFEVGGDVIGDILKKVKDEVDQNGKHIALPEAEFTLYTNENCTEVYKNSKHTNDNYTVKSDAEGKLHITGLAAGKYYLKETKAPDTYSLNNTVYRIEVTATVVSEELTTWTIKVTPNDGTEAKENTFGVENNEVKKPETVISTEIVNTKLSALPSTGGIGTTIFTIAGCLIMVTAAGLFFASRKRTNK